MGCYEVRNETNKDVGIDILFTFYGTLWESVMDRLNNRCDGFILTIQHRGNIYRVYRKIGKR
jgi:hypothetical protein